MSAFRTHLASCGSIGFSGRRCGTTYAHSPRVAYALLGQPWFRFRNDECERICREEWAKPAPTEGEYFVVVPDSEEPDNSWSTRTEGELLKCSLAQYERDGIASWARHLQRLGTTNYYRWYEKRPDYCWHPRGRLLKLTKAGRAIAAATRSAETRSRLSPKGSQSVIAQNPSPSKYPS